MTDIAQNDENFGLVPPSTGKKKKARRVFGKILSSDLNHSLTYSPSPMKTGKDRDGSQSPSKSQEYLATNLFPIAEAGGNRKSGMSGGRKSETSSSQPGGGRKSGISSQQSATGRSESSSIVVKPFSNILGSTDDTDEENSASEALVPRSIRVPTEKSSGGSKLSLPFYTKEERFAKTTKPPRAYTGLRSSSTARVGTMQGSGSVNQALNAARRARERALKEKAKAAASIRGQWKDEKDEALEFYDETEKLRRERLNLQCQLSSNFSRAKAQRTLNKRQAQREKAEKDAIFNSDVAREHRQKLKEMEDRRRRESVAVRAKIRANNRQGEEKLKQIKMEEEEAIHDERYASSQAFQQYDRERLESARKNYQFKRGDAMRIRELHDEMERQRKQEEHESFELMLAASRDADEYHKDLALQRRQSLEGRNAKAREERQRAEELRAKQLNAQHESYELKRAAEKDAENHKRDLEDKRRDSLAFRGEEARKQREIMAEQEAERKKAEHESYQLKFQADRDEDEYRQKEALLRRKSLEKRGADAREIRQKQLNDEGRQLEQEHKSWELKFDGEKDAEEYHRQMDEKRRQSLQHRNKEARRQREEEDKRRAQAARLAHESYELKWDGERDAKEYLAQLEQERRDSLQARNLEAQQQRDQARDQRSAALKAEHQSFELQRAANKDVDEYHKKLEQDRRDSLSFRNKEKARHAMVMAELDTLAKEQEAESYALKWDGDNDAKAYQLELEEERRKSLRFRNEEAKRHREIDDEMYRQAITEKHKDEELRAADQKDVENYRDECAERDRASLEYRGKEATIRRLEEINEMQRQRETEEGNRQLEALARADVQDYIKSCKTQRRKSLAFRAKEKRRHAEWTRQEEQRELEQKIQDARLRARDTRSMELARQKERTEKALDALRHASCSFSSFPAAS